MVLCANASVAGFHFYPPGVWKSSLYSSGLNKPNVVFANEYSEPTEHTFRGPKRRLAKVQKNGRFIEPLARSGLIPRGTRDHVGGHGHAQLETEKPDSSLDLNEKNMAENDLVNELPKSTAGVTSNDKRSTPFRSTRLTSCSQTFAVHSGLTSMFSWLPSGTGVRPRSDW